MVNDSWLVTLRPDMEGLTTHAPMTDVLRARGAFDSAPFVLIDVGCAGGIDDAWRVFGSTLIARGYDPDVAACEEAAAREPFKNVRYHARYVGLRDTHPFAQKRNADATRWPQTNIWARITAGEMARRSEGTSAMPRRVADPNTVIGVDEIVRAEGLSTVDFLKIDVDGPDLEVLESARDVLARSNVLGVGMEVNWFGSNNPTEHTFHNTDRFLREQGFALFGVTFRRYSRTDLPAPFEYEFYAQTRFGQPYQGDAIYIRDLAAPHLRALAEDYPPDKLMKLACVYELCGVPDCAAEVLNQFHARLEPFGDLEPLLDALTPPLLGERVTYREYISRYESEPHLFLPSAEARVRGAQAELGEQPSAASPASIDPSAAHDSAAQTLLGRVRRRLLRRL